jgi:hypothetical protein
MPELNAWGMEVKALHAMKAYLQKYSLHKLYLYSLSFRMAFSADKAQQDTCYPVSNDGSLDIAM